MQNFDSFLLPERNVDFFQLHSAEDLDSFLDFRADCLQTGYNFSAYSNASFQDKKFVIQFLEKNLLASSKKLAKYDGFLKSNFSVDGQLIPWPHIKIKPYLVPLGKPVEFFPASYDAYKKIGDNLLPCNIHL